VVLKIRGQASCLPLLSLQDIFGIYFEWGGKIMPDDIRIKRIGAFFLQELSRVVSRELRNPIFENKVISFADIKVSKDLSIAHVSVSILGDQDLLENVIKALTDAEPIIRREIREVCDLRKVPHFVFHPDRTMERAADIEKILNSLDIPPEEPECPTEDDLKVAGEPDEDEDDTDLEEDEILDDEEDEEDEDDGEFK
jgi:ribosome-binding factor A